METPSTPGLPHSPGSPATPGQSSASASGSPAAPAGSSKIVHSRVNVGSGAGAGAAPTARPAPPAGAPAGGENVAAHAPPPAAAPPKISTFGREKKHEDLWQRTPNTTGAGAIHVKTFHCKLTEDAIMYMDQAINEWLDAHPQYEVKFVSSTIGTMTGKLKEPALFCQVWV
jgi:hypothetical protein